MLSRFRKQGGFLQLVNLIETCEPSKRKNLMHLVASEDPGWAHLVSKKIITVEKILGWPDHVLMEVLPHLPMMMLATLFKCQPPEFKVRIESGLTARQNRELSDLAQTLPDLSMNSGEYFTASIKLIQLVRQLESDGKINFQHVDPTLVIDVKIAS